MSAECRGTSERTEKGGYLWTWTISRQGPGRLQPAAAEEGTCRRQLCCAPPLSVTPDVVSPAAEASTDPPRPVTAKARSSFTSTRNAAALRLVMSTSNPCTSQHLHFSDHAHPCHPSTAQLDSLYSVAGPTFYRIIFTTACVPPSIFLYEEE